MNQFFDRIAKKAARWVGSPLAFVLALVALVVWATTGPVTRFSNTWQLVINTGTTIVTFLTVFLIQNQQNRDSKAIHLKLDEILRSLPQARDAIIDIEDASDDDLDKLESDFKEIKEEGEAGADDALEAIEQVREGR